MRKRWVLNGALGLVVIGLALGAFATVRSSSGAAATTQTVATAKRGVVLQSVTSTGNLEASADLSLSFQQAGAVTKIFVEPGDHVRAQQALAQVENGPQKMALASAQASLVSAQANLAALQRGETAVERQADASGAASAAQSVAAAQLGLVQAQQNATGNVAKYQQAIDQAQTALDSVNADVLSAQTDLNQANIALTALQRTYDPSRSGAESIAATLTRYQLDQVNCANHAADPSFHPGDGVTCSQVANLLSFAKGVQTAQSVLTQAQSQQTSAQASLASADQAKSSGTIQDQQAIQNAQLQLTSAQDQYSSTIVGNAVKQQPPKPEALAQAQAAIVSAQAQVSTARKNLDDTTLRAPVAGVVAAVNGQVGQQSGSGSSSATSSSTSASSSSSSSTSSSSGSGFIDLTDVKLLDVKVGFTESDAPKVKVGQKATITLDALPGQTFNGTVVELDTDSTLVSNVVTYYAKVSFDSAAAGVKPGMTASVTVVLDKRDDAITLPTSAVATTGTSQTVTVKAKDGSESARPIQIGLRGDNAVEITSGLQVGDQVVITSTASTSGGGGFVPGGGGAGGGITGGRGLGGRGGAG
jgi:multidrug efflux pump subunit AcrA (membrane-fusion protein)